MKQFLPYNVLLILAIAGAALMAFYNLALRETFAITVAYTLPAIQRPESPQQAVSAGEPKYSDSPDVQSEWEDSYFGQEGTTPIAVEFPLDLNFATEQELKYIPQVGDVMAQRIVQYREHLGGYTSLEQLKEIKGVGEKTYENISAYLFIAQEPE